MPWGKIAIVGLASLVTIGLGLVVTQPWDGTRPVDALELDQAWREEDSPSPAVGGEDDDDDDTGNGARRPNASATDDGRDGTRDGDTREGAGTGAATDDGRDGTRDGDTRGERDTGTADDTVVAHVGGGGGTDTNGDTNGGGGGGGTGTRDGASGGGDT